MPGGSGEHSTPSKEKSMLQHQSQLPVQQLVEKEELVVVVLVEKRRRRKGSLSLIGRRDGVGHRSSTNDSCTPSNSSVAPMVGHRVHERNTCRSHHIHTICMITITYLVSEELELIACSRDAEADQRADEGGWPHQR